MRGTGRFNLAQGLVALSTGLGAGLGELIECCLQAVGNVSQLLPVFGSNFSAPSQKRSQIIPDTRQYIDARQNESETQRVLLFFRRKRDEKVNFICRV
jgi:hypothetical protein